MRHLNNSKEVKRVLMFGSEPDCLCVAHGSLELTAPLQNFTHDLRGNHSNDVSAPGMVLFKNRQQATGRTVKLTGSRPAFHIRPPGTFLTRTREKMIHEEPRHNVTSRAKRNSDAAEVRSVSVASLGAKSCCNCPTEASL